MLYGAINRKPMTLESGIEIPMDRISELCRRFDVAELAVFGSAARDDMHSDSDVDVMVEFAPSARVCLLRFAELSDELDAVFGRKVDLVTKPGLKPWVRANVIGEARLVFTS